MPNVQLPFWIVAEQRRVLNPPQNIPCDAPLTHHLFTHPDDLTAFMAAHRGSGGKWNVTHVPDEAALILAVATLHDEEVDYVCYNPGPDGSDGTIIRVADLLGATCE